MKIQKVSNSVLITFLLLFPFFKPHSLEYIAPQIDSLYDYLRVGICILVAYAYIKKIVLKRRGSIFLVIVLIYEFLLIVSTSLNHQNMRSAFLSAVLIICFCMIVELGIKENCVVFITALYWLTFILVFMNFVILLWYPDGVARHKYYYYRVNFWHIDNLLVSLLIFAMAVGELYVNLLGHWTVSSIVLMGICGATTIICWSATGVVGWGVYCFFLLFICNKPWQRYINAPFVYLVWVLSFVSLCFWGIQKKFLYLIENILKKNINLTGRTEIWDISIHLIQEKWLFGYGVPLTHGYVFWRNKFYHTHNGIFEIMIQGGIITLIPAVILYILSANILVKYRSNKLGGIILGAITAILVTLLTEAYISDITIYGLLMLSYCIPEIEQQMICGIQKVDKRIHLKKKRVVINIWQKIK